MAKAWTDASIACSIALTLAKFQGAYMGIESQRGDATLKVGWDSILWGNGLTLSTDLDGGVVDLTTTSP